MVRQESKLKKNLPSTNSCYSSWSLLLKKNNIYVSAFVRLGITNICRHFRLDRNSWNDFDCAEIRRRRGSFTSNDPGLRVMSTYFQLPQALAVSLSFSWASFRMHTILKYARSFRM